jgi:Gas vesicle synthesis protein GvpL/GvpF
LATALVPREVIGSAVEHPFSPFDVPRDCDTIEAVEMEETATYLYCIVHSDVAPVTTKAPRGVPGATRPVIAAVANSLWLVTADLPLKAYGSAPLEAALRDVQWVTDLAVAHESVVEFFAHQAGATVIPMKLLTMFSSEKRAVTETRSRLRDIEAVVSRIAGCEEWGVRITRKPTARSEPSGRQARSSSGTAFLTAKKTARDAARHSAGAAAEHAERAYTTLAAIARDARRRHDVPQGATSPPLLDAAFLVPAAGRSRFKAAVKKLAGAPDAGIQVTLTGPWPSYNFVQPESNS